MSKQLDVSQTIEHLTGLKVSITQSLQDPADPWTWQPEVIGPKIDGALLPHVEKFKRDWEEFTHRKKALTEGTLIAGFGKFLQEKYFHWKSTT